MKEIEMPIIHHIGKFELLNTLGLLDHVDAS